MVMDVDGRPDAAISAFLGMWPDGSVASGESFFCVPTSMFWKDVPMFFKKEKSTNALP